MTLFIVLLSIFYVDAFLPQAHPRAARAKRVVCARDMQEHCPQALTHADILWKLRPPPSTSFFQKLLLQFCANAIRLDCYVRHVDPPFVLCPKGGQAVVEAYYQDCRIARFGITTVRGPSAKPIHDTVENIYGIELDGRHQTVGTAAIIYMFVEEPYRSQGVGALALDVISTIHSLQGCDFTVLVADDDGSGKLVKWYEQHGFTQAPLLQDMLGSPNKKYGIAMIAPTRNEIDPFCRIQWW